MSIKIFYMNDCDWFAGEDLESCIQSYLKDYVTQEDTEFNRAEFIDDPYELDDDQMDRMQFHTDEGKTMSFREALNDMIASGVTFPSFFATTEY